jgi:hypothetical protein
VTGKAVHAKTKEQHINTKIKYKNTTQDKNRGTTAVVWLNWCLLQIILSLFLK